MRRLKNQFGNKQLVPSQVYQAGVYLFEQKYGPGTALTDNSDNYILQGQEYGRIYREGDQTIIWLLPGHDSDRSIAGFKLKDIIKQLNSQNEIDISTDNIKIYFPICESKSILGKEVNHFVLGVKEGDHVTVYDSENKLRESAYPITLSIQSVFGSAVTVQSKASGKQKDNYSCGHWVIAQVNALVNGNGEIADNFAPDDAGTIAKQDQWMQNGINIISPPGNRDEESSSEKDTSDNEDGGVLSWSEDDFETDNAGQQEAGQNHGTENFPRQEENSRAEQAYFLAHTIPILLPFAIAFDIGALFVSGAAWVLSKGEDPSPLKTLKHGVGSFIEGGASFFCCKTPHFAKDFKMDENKSPSSA